VDAPARTGEKGSRVASPGLGAHAIRPSANAGLSTREQRRERPGDPTYTRVVVGARWSGRAGEEPSDDSDSFRALLEEAPVAALLLDSELQVHAANRAARAFFGIDEERLPQSLLDSTREGRLLEALRAGRQEAEIRLSHRKRVVQSRLVGVPRRGDALLFVTDVTELRRLETVRQEFVANLSHELKTPITSLRLAAESLTGNPPAQARRRFAERALKEADHLSAVVANLRQLAEIEQGRLAFQVSRFDVAELVAEVAERLRLDRRVEVRVPPGLAVTGDRSKLAQALGNLVDNAARFSPPGSAVEVEAEVAEGELQLSVRDHGPGISPEHWSRVFERFYKVDPARPRDAGGSGLGLAITKHLALAQGGRVWTGAGRDGGQVFGIGVPADMESLGGRSVRRLLKDP
jgi:signal transduction histidine kinase